MKELHCTCDTASYGGPDPTCPVCYPKKKKVIFVDVEIIPDSVVRIANAIEKGEMIVSGVRAGKTYARALALAKNITPLDTPHKLQDKEPMSYSPLIFAKEFLKRRLALGWSQPRTASVLDYSERTICAWEGGNCALRPEMMEVILTKLDKAITNQKKIVSSSVTKKKKSKR